MVHLIYCLWISTSIAKFKNGGNKQEYDVFWLVLNGGSCPMKTCGICLQLYACAPMEKNKQENTRFKMVRVSK